MKSPQKGTEKSKYELEIKIQQLEKENKILTEKLQSYSKSKLQNEEIEILNQIHNALYHNPHLGIFQYDKEGIITDCNDVFNNYNRFIIYLCLNEVRGFAKLDGGGIVDNVA